MGFFWGILISIVSGIALHSQGRSDFFDNYDYSLRNYQGGKTIGTESYQEYKLPRPRKKVTLPDPKNVRQAADPSAIIPPPAGLRRSTNANANPTQTINPSSYPVNPITGELNVEAILKSQDEKREKKEAAKKAREAKSNEEYTETPFRRSEIIFFTTLPFAVAGSVVIAQIINQVNTGFYKSNAGAAFVGIGAIGLSAGNVYLDKVRLEEFEKGKNLQMGTGSHQKNLEMNFTLFQIHF